MERAGRVRREEAGGARAEGLVAGVRADGWAGEARAVTVDLDTSSQVLAESMGPALTPAAGDRPTSIVGPDPEEVLLLDGPGPEAEMGIEQGTQEAAAGQTGPAAPPQAAGQARGVRHNGLASEERGARRSEARGARRSEARGARRSEARDAQIERGCAGTGPATAPVGRSGGRAVLVRSLGVAGTGEGSGLGASRTRPLPTPSRPSDSARTVWSCPRLRLCPWARLRPSLRTWPLPPSSRFVRRRQAKPKRCP